MRAASWVVLGMVFVSAATAAQNGSNYHVLDNGPDATLIGVGAGGTQTAQDGLGTYIPGEDLRGSLLVDPDDDGPLGTQFCYRSVAVTESVCVFGPGTSGNIELRFPGLYFIELDGLDPNHPVVFTRPICGVPLASAIPYGTGPASTVSFVATVVSAMGPMQVVILPDNGLVAGTGTATRVAEGAAALGPVPSGCYTVQFTWAPSAVPFLDGIDGLWHYVVNSDDGNQYWQMSVDEMNLWQSNSVLLDNGATETRGFHAVTDYAMLISSREANTHAALAPHGIEQAGPYYHQTENMAREGAPNFGFDVGRGSRAMSLSGLGGVEVPAALGGHGHGAQDPRYGSGDTIPTLGFVTWDDKPNGSVAGFGSRRITWISVDWAQQEGKLPTPGVTEAGGTVRLPVETIRFIHPLTVTWLSVFQHGTKAAPSGWPHPHGVGFVQPEIAGGSRGHRMSALFPRVPCNSGIPLNLQYGTTGMNPDAPPILTFDPSVADISGRKELYLFQ